MNSLNNALIFSITLIIFLAGCTTQEQTPMNPETTILYDEPSQAPACSFNGKLFNIQGTCKDILEAIESTPIKYLVMAEYATTEPIPQSAAQVLRELIANSAELGKTPKGQKLLDTLIEEITGRENPTIEDLTCKPTNPSINTEQITRVRDSPQWIKN